MPEKGELPPALLTIAHNVLFSGYWPSLSQAESVSYATCRVGLVGVGDGKATSLMLKHSFGLAALWLGGSALALGCGGDSGDGGEGASWSGPPPPVVGGSGGGGQVVIFGGSGGSNSGSVFDGGVRQLTPEQADVIRKDQCASWVTEVEVQPAMLEMVVDISSSMNEKAPGGSGQTRWEVASAALLEAVVGVNGSGLPANVSVGMLLYPGLETDIGTSPQDAGMCVNVDAMVAPDELGPANSPQRGELRDAIRNARLLQSTPTHDAYRYALEEGLVPAQFGGPKFMLLITDGAPTVEGGCMTATGELQSGVNPQPIVEEVRNAAENHDVRTFLIGVPGSEPNRQWMSTAAQIGGTAPAGCSADGGKSGSNYCHMDMTTAPDFARALRDGLNTVLGVVSPCSFSFAEPPNGQQIDSQKINVLLSEGGNNTLVVRDDTGDCSQGWQMTADKKILLCPDTCADVQANPGIAIDVTFGCTSYREPPIVE